MIRVVNAHSSCTLFIQSSRPCIASIKKSRVVSPARRQALLEDDTSFCENYSKSSLSLLDRKMHLFPGISWVILLQWRDMQFSKQTSYADLEVRASNFVIVLEENALEVKALRKCPFRIWYCRWNHSQTISPGCADNCAIRSSEQQDVFGRTRHCTWTRKSLLQVPEISNRSRRSLFEFLIGYVKSNNWGGDNCFVINEYATIISKNVFAVNAWDWSITSIRELKLRFHTDWGVHISENFTL